MKRPATQTKDSSIKNRLMYKFRFHPSIIKSTQTFSIERKTAFQPIIEEFIKNIVTHVSTIMDIMFCHFLMFYEIFL